jgi:hypothetical protein
MITHGNYRVFFKLPRWRCFNELDGYFTVPLIYLGPAPLLKIDPSVGGCLLQQPTGLSVDVIGLLTYTRSRNSNE